MKHRRGIGSGALGAVLFLTAAIGVIDCSSDSGGSGGADRDASTAEGGGTGGGSSTAGAGGNSGAGGGGGTGGAGGSQSAECARANSRGFFPDCSLCGPDCDTLDDGTGERRACGCSGGCPCGLRCGSYEIAPGVTVSNICVR